jgi:hypothetical protein
MPIELHEATIPQLSRDAAECYESARHFRERLIDWGFPGDGPASVRQGEFAAEISAMHRTKLFALLEKPRS